MSGGTRKYNFSGRKLDKSGEEKEDTDPLLVHPINAAYFEKLPEGMEPQTWLRLKTVLAMRIPPSPTLGDYPMSFHDQWWDIRVIPVKQKNNTVKNLYMLIYNYKSKHEEDGLAASLMFDQIMVKQVGRKGNVRQTPAYNIVNIKFAMYDVEISENVNIRLISNPV